MSHYMLTPAPPRLSKGDITRKKILTAALDLIAQGGLASLSHRTIADAAGVRLSLTSYYFGSLEKLITAAFDQFAAEYSQYVVKAYQVTEAVYEQYLRADDRRLDMEGFLAAITEALVNQLEFGILHRRRELSIECHFLFALNPSPELSQSIGAYVEFLYQLAEHNFEKMGSKSPKADAHIMVALIQQFQFSSVGTATPPNRHFVYNSIHRLLSALIGGVPSARAAPAPAASRPRAGKNKVSA